MDMILIIIYLTLLAIGIWLVAKFVSLCSAVEAILQELKEINTNLDKKEDKEA